MIKLSCNYCGNDIFKYPSQLYGHKLFFCNPKCQYSKYRGVDKGGKKLINCDYCNKEVLKNKSQILNNKHTFCNRDCSDLYKIGKLSPLKGKEYPQEIGLKISLAKGGRIITNCSYCKKEFKMIHSQFNNYKTHFCSRICKFKYQSISMRGKNNPCYGRLKDKNPNWLGGRSSEPYSLSFNSHLKEKIRYRDNYICKLCNSKQKEEALDVHHIDYDKNNSEFNNLIALCSSCHAKTNFNREYWSNLFKNIMEVKDGNKTKENFNPISVGPFIGCNSSS